MYPNLLGTRLIIDNEMINPATQIARRCLIFAHAYRVIISAIIAITRIAPTSGIKRKRMKTIPNIVASQTKNVVVWSRCFFLKSQELKKITNHTLKNSAGCTVPIPGTLNHHLAPLSSIPIPGTNTKSCKMITPIAIVTTIDGFLRILIGRNATKDTGIRAMMIFFICSLK
jgi:hypothetical protein